MTTNDDDVQEATPAQITVNAGYGANTKKPFVSLRLKDVAVMMSPEEAQDIAHNLLECAEAAMSDMFIVEWAMGKIGVDLEHAAILLAEFRAVRDARREEW